MKFLTISSKVRPQHRPTAPPSAWFYCYSDHLKVGEVPRAVLHSLAQCQPGFQSVSGPRPDRVRWWRVLSRIRSLSLSKWTDSTFLGKFPKPYCSITHLVNLNLVKARSKQSRPWYFKVLPDPGLIRVKQTLGDMGTLG
jgi:hypothetical protein